MRRWILGLGAVAVLIAAAVAVGKLRGARSAAAADEGRKPLAVTVGAVEARKVARKVNVVGSFRGFDEVTVMAEVSGRIVKYHYDVGDVVRPGDVLVEIDPTDYALALEETKRALELDAARIGLEVPPDDRFTPEAILAALGAAGFDINKLPSVAKAIEQENLARIRFDRARDLHSRNANTNDELDQRSTDYQVAVTSRLQAQMDARAVVAAIKHRVVLLRIALQKLQKTKVLVPEPTPRPGLPQPVEYRVAERKVSEGEMVKDAAGASTTVYELVTDAVLKLTANVPERFAGQIREGQAAEVAADAYPGRLFAGTVNRVNPTVDRTSRTFEVEIRVPNAKRELKAGGFAKVDIVTQPEAEAWTVPVEAVVSFAGSVKVYALRDGTARAVPIARGLEGRGWVEVVRVEGTDLRLGEPVILTGHEKLAEGVAVRVREPETQEKRDAPKEQAKGEGEE